MIINLLSIFSFGLLLVKFYTSVYAVSNLNNYYPDSLYQNYIANMKDILTKQNFQTIFPIFRCYQVEWTFQPIQCQNQLLNFMTKLY